MVLLWQLLEPLFLRVYQLGLQNWIVFGNSTVMFHPFATLVAKFVIYVACDITFLGSAHYPDLLYV